MLYKTIRSISCLSIFVSLMTFMPLAHAGYFSDFNYYLGAAAGYQHVGYKDDYGSGFFPNNTIDYELYYGMQKINKFGFEFGLSYTPDVNRDVRLNSGDKFPGTTRALAAGTYQVWNPHYNTDSVYIGVNRYFSLNTSNNFRGFMLLGVAFANVEMEVNFVDDDLPGLPSTYEQSINYTSYTDSTLIPIVKLGIEYDLGKGFGTRLNYTWKNYAAFGGIKSDQFPNGAAEVRLANTNALYLGFYLTL